MYFQIKKEIWENIQWFFKAFSKKEKIIFGEHFTLIKSLSKKNVLKQIIINYFIILLTFLSNQLKCYHLKVLSIKKINNFSDINILDRIQIIPI